MAKHLEDYGVIETKKARIKSHQDKCKQLPIESQAKYWKDVYRREPDLFEFMHGHKRKKGRK